MRIEVENTVAIVETRVHEAIFSALDKLVVPRMELAMGSFGTSWTGNPSSVVIDPDQRYFYGDTNGLQMTTPRRVNSDLNLNGIDKTRGTFTVEEGGLPVGGRSLDRETDARQ